MPSTLFDVGLGSCFSLSEYADDLFLESALNSNCHLEHLDPLFLSTPSESPSHPSTEDSFYPPVNTTVLSDEIWKKFDLPEDEQTSQWPSTDEYSLDWNAFMAPGLHSAITVVLETGKARQPTGAKELRHHDCMWTGECKNKEHVKNRPKASTGDQRVVAPGQTLLKNPMLPKENSPTMMMKAPSPLLTASPTVLRVPKGSGCVLTRTPAGKSLLVRSQPRSGGARPGDSTTTTKVVTVCVPAADDESRNGNKSATSSSRSFCSEGSSPRPETPLSLSEEEDDEGGTAKCDDVGRVGCGSRGPTPEDLEEAEAAQAFAEAMALAAAEEEEECGEAVSMAEVSGQVRMSGDSSTKAVDTEKTNVCYLDHDYHKSNNTKGAPVKTDHLGVQTPSDSEEEIDVVGWNGGDKTAPVRSNSNATTSRTTNKTNATSGRQTSGRVNLPTNPSARDRHQLQLTVEAAIAKVSANAAAGFEDEDDEEYGESDEEAESEEEEEEYEEYDSSEGHRESQHSNHHSSSSRHHNGGKSNGVVTKRHASSEDAGPVAKQPRIGHHQQHKRRSRTQREDDPDYDGHSTASWSYNSYLSSSSSGTSSPPRRRGGHRKRPHRHSYEGGDSAPEDPLERRSMHNTMERQRRIDLRNAFENLRLLVPTVSDKERAAKVTILREAAGFCAQLVTQGGKQVDSIKALRARQVALRAQVSSLRRSLAASR